MTPSSPLPDPLRVDYLHAISSPRPRTSWRAVATSLLQAPRLLLLAGFFVYGSAIARALYLTWRATCDGCTTFALWGGMVGVLVLWGTLLLSLELVLLVVRDATALPWPARTPTGTRILLRALGGTVLMGLTHKIEISPLVAMVPMASIAYAVYAWGLPSSLRGLRNALVGLASLRVRGAPASPGRLAGAGPVRGRRIVTGRWSKDRGPVTMEGDGAIAWLDGVADLVDVGNGALGDGPPRAVVAEVHADGGGGYRSAGIRLLSGGLPVWLLRGDDHEATVGRVRRRLRLSAVLDGAHVFVAVAGAALVALYLVAYALR